MIIINIYENIIQDMQYVYLLFVINIKLSHNSFNKITYKTNYVNNRI